MKKKTLALVLAVVMAFGATFGATFAFLMDNEKVTNTFTVGNVDIELEEPNWDFKGSEDAPEVYPGEALAKDPTVTNVGKNPCFVRVKVEGLDQFDEMIALRHGNYAEGYDSTNWTLYEGYYYYNTVLAVEAVTEPVFNQVVMPTSLVGAEEAEPIVVTAEAVQAQGAKASWADVEAMTVAEIAAWFANCMPAA